MFAQDQDTCSTASIIFHGKEGQLDTRLRELGEFFGLQLRNLSIGTPENRETFLSLGVRPACVMVSASSLAAILGDTSIPEAFVAQLFEGTPFVFVYGITDGGAHANAIRSLTDGLVSSVDHCNGPDYQISSTSPEITGEFSGLTFGPINKETDYGFTLGRSDDAFSDIVSIDGLPFFACLQRPGSKLFLLACGDLVDVQSETDGSLTAREYFSRLVPAVMFLKYVFKEQIWHNPKSRANLVIDDPLLRESYGFLSYSRLLEEMDACNFNSTIAFIPWNYRRTHPAIAKLVNERSDRFSVCVHGCDHTGGEFASTDIEDLDSRCCLATQRMKTHEETTGVKYAEIMVFPQGRFSSVSLSLLKSNNYLAAVNSTPKPEDLGTAHGLKVADLLSPAVTTYGGFPLFIRRYPKHLEDFALDLFLGKPALLVEHHGYFKDGYKKIREFTAQINSLSPKVEWVGLGDLVSHTRLQRSTTPGTIECKIFANRQVIDNPTPTAKRFNVFKPEDSRIPIKEVTVDGKPHPYAIENEHMRLCVDVPASGAVEVRIEYARAHRFTSPARERSLGQNLQVYVRRHLSEARDNHLSKHDWLLSFAYRVKDGRLFGL